MDVFSLIKRYTQLISLDLSKEQITLFYEFYLLLKAKNEEINFTRIHSLEEIIRKHFIDSLIVQTILDQHHILIPDPIMDLGTGGGFPGIPLAIINPEKTFLLIESRINRVEYLKEVKERLKLNNIEVLHKTLTHKDEVLCKSVITRAFESIKDTAIRTDSSLEKEGLLIFLKGPNCEEEIQQMNHKNFELILNYDYALPMIQGDDIRTSKDIRKLLIYRKKISRKYFHDPFYRKYFKITEKIYIKNISSPQNETYKFIKKLFHSKEIQKTGKTIICGEKIINEFMNHFPQNLLSIIFTNDFTEEKLIQFYESIKHKNPHIEYIYLHKELLRDSEIMNYPPPYLMVKINPIQNISHFKFDSSFLVLPLQDPINLGACIRSSYAFGITNIILTKESCNPFLLKSIRSSAGTVFHCNFYELNFEQRKEILSKSPLPIYVLDLSGENIHTINKPSSFFGLIIGEEGRGIPKDLLSKDFHRISIPMKNPIDSLNVSVACGIALFYLQT